MALLLPEQGGGLLPLLSFNIPPFSSLIKNDCLAATGMDFSAECPFVSLAEVAADEVPRDFCLCVFLRSHSIERNCHSLIAGLPRKYGYC